MVGCDLTWPIPPQNNELTKPLTSKYSIMKNLLMIVLAGLFVMACQEKQPVRFTTSSPEIDSYKKGIEAYEKADWAAWASSFSDTVKIYHNTWDTPSTAAEVQERHVNTLSNLSSYGFDKDDMVFEQTLDDDGKTWVNFWGLWKGTLKANGKELSIPVHISAEYVDGKIVREYGFWNMSEFVDEMQALQAAAEAAAETEEAG